MSDKYVQSPTNNPVTEPAETSRAFKVTAVIVQIISFIFLIFGILAMGGNYGFGYAIPLLLIEILLIVLAEISLFWRGSRKFLLILLSVSFLVVGIMYFIFWYKNNINMYSYDYGVSSDVHKITSSEIVQALANAFSFTKQYFLVCILFIAASTFNYKKQVLTARYFILVAILIACFSTVAGLFAYFD